jgi:Zn-dependent peptidase ImmA (M78 family)/transcriptional regulator with XRE-family HTH domain
MAVLPTEGLSARIAARLKQAREDVGLTLAQASKDMGFENYQVLMNIEKGERAVKALELLAFAQIYVRSLDFFLSTAEPAPRPAVAWRERRDEARAKQVEGKFLSYCEDYARLETFADGEPTQFRLECGSKVNTYDVAVELGEDLGRRLELGSHPAHGLCAVLEEHGVKIMVDELSEAGSAASTRGDFGAGILINWSSAPWRTNYDIAHELFHLLTWQQFPLAELTYPKGEKSLADRFADAFASAFLLPEASVVKEFRDRTKGKDLTYLDCVSMASDFGVSRQALLWRLINLRLVTKDSGTKAMESDSLRHIDREVRRENRNSPVEWPTPRFVATAFKCLQLGRVSRARFAQLMGIQRHQIDAFLAERDYDASEDYAGEISTA